MFPSDDVQYRQGLVALVRAERSIERAVLDVVDDWLEATRFVILRELAQQMGLTAAGDHADAVDAATAAYDTWRKGVNNRLAPEIGIAFGEAYRQIRHGSPPQRYETAYLETVVDRLVAWPAGAMDDVRAELVDALQSGEDYKQMGDKIGAILGMDGRTRQLRAEISYIEHRLQHDDTLTQGERKELAAARRELWREHDEALGDWQWKARRIARTEAHAAQEYGKVKAAQDEAFESGQAMWKRWRSARDTRVRASHRVADGQCVKLVDRFRVGGVLLEFPGDPAAMAPQETIQCVLGGTQVAWPGQQVLHSMRRRYEGALVELVTTDGHHLTITPNHPVLTTTGYVPAGLLSPGDHVFATTPASAPHVGDVPPSAEQLHRAVRGSGVKKRVMGVGVDFHGDRSADDEVEVVSPDWNLSYNGFASRAGDSLELSLVGVGDTESVRSRQGASESRLGQLGAGERIRAGRVWRMFATCLVGGARKITALLGCHARHSDSVGLALRADGQSELLQPALDDATVDAEAASHRKYALAVGMQPSQLIQVDITYGSHWVYNLSSSKQGYIANGILVHNCRCISAIYSADQLQDGLQGPDGSIGEVKPGGVRIGPDDPDAADKAIDQAADDLGQPRPPKVRGEDAGQAPPDPVEPVTLTEERAAPLPDLSGVDDDDLVELLAKAHDKRDDDLYEWADAEWGRRRARDDGALPLPADPPDRLPLGDDDDGRVLGGPTSADADELATFLDLTMPGDDLTDDEQAAVLRWQGMDRFYQRVQHVARGNAHDPEAEEVAELLSELIERGEVGQPIVAWRGQRNAVAAFGVPADELAGLVGESITAGGFYAVSADRDIAVSGFTVPGRDPVIVRVSIAAGVSAFWVSPTGSPDLADQRELLMLAPTLDIVGVSEGTGGQPPIVDVEIRE